MRPAGKFGAIILLALVVVSVQLGVVRHSIEATPQHVDAVCGYCLAADHTTPVLPAASIALPIFEQETNAIAATPTVPAATPHADHPVRAPPATV